MLETEGARLARELAMFVNRHGARSPEAKDFVAALMREHRTLQQAVFGLFLMCVKEWRNLWLKRPERHFDARNEWTCEKSNDIVGVLGEYTLTPPLI